jgi:nucleoside 2-deoxyribosyltransferase
MDCLQCGEFEISRTALVNGRNWDDNQRAKLSAWIFAYRPSLISSDDVSNAINATRPSLQTRARSMLTYISNRYGAGHTFDYSSFSRPVSDGNGGQRRPVANSLIPVGWNADEGEARFMLDTVLLDEVGYLKTIPTNVGPVLQISPKGWMALEGERTENSAIGFTAMWFSPTVQSLYDDAIKPAIASAGYEPLRIDAKEHNNKIDDEIVASIRAAKFVVADYTGERGGVYYEAGFAHGLGIPVIFMAKEGTEIHFDTRQFNTIFWSANDLASARDRLRNRILATLGQGPRNV